MTTDQYPLQRRIQSLIVCDIETAPNKIKNLDCLSRFFGESFACHVVGYRKVDTTFGTTAGENLTAVLGGHSQTKTVLVDSSAS